jgi:hypothetical protein
LLATGSESVASLPVARIAAPTFRNVAVFGLSLLPWPTMVAAVLVLLTGRFEPRVWLALTVGWSMVEFIIRNPEQVTLVRLPADRAGHHAYCLNVRTWWSLLVRTGGRTIALGPESRLVRNTGVVDCATGKLVELRIYRWQYSELVRAFGLAGFEVHDECRHASRWQTMGPAVLVAVAAVAIAAVAVVEIHGL